MPGLKKPVLLVGVPVVAILSAIFLLMSDSSHEPPTDSVVLARVGSNFLTESDLLEWLGENRTTLNNISEMRGAVQRWIDTELLAAAAIDNDVVNLPLIDRRIHNFKKSLLADAMLEVEFRNQPLVTREEINRYYQENLESYRRKREEIRAYHFLVDTRSEAQDLRDALLTEDDNALAELLRKYSGTLRTINRDNVIPEISSAVFGSRRTVVGPVETIFGFHVLKLEDRLHEGDYKLPEELRDEIIQQIKVNKQKLLYYELADSLRLSADWQIYEDFFSANIQ